MYGLDGPVNETNFPKGTSIEYCVAYPDPHPYMDGPRMYRLPQPHLGRAREALDFLKRLHPDARIQTRLVYPWQDAVGE
jgi:hypothetical protein